MELEQTVPIMNFTCIFQIDTMKYQFSSVSLECHATAGVWPPQLLQFSYDLVFSESTCCLSSSKFHLFTFFWDFFLHSFFSIALFCYLPWPIHGSSTETLVSRDLWMISFAYFLFLCLHFWLYLPNDVQYCSLYASLSNSHFSTLTSVII